MLYQQQVTALRHDLTRGAGPHNRAGLSRGHATRRSNDSMEAFCADTESFEHGEADALIGRDTHLRRIVPIARFAWSHWPLGRRPQLKNSFLPGRHSSGEIRIEAL
jgi:hypothetical protein